jgi:hypothetical protein
VLDKRERHKNRGLRLKAGKMVDAGHRRKSQSGRLARTTEFTGATLGVESSLLRCRALGQEFRSAKWQYLRLLLLLRLPELVLYLHF